MSEDVSLFALNLKSVAKRERNIGNATLSALIDKAALMIDRLASLQTEPEVVTPEMVEAGIGAWMDCASTRTADILRATYLAMRSAALRGER